MGHSAHPNRRQRRYGFDMVESYISERVALGEFAPSTAEVVRYVLLNWMRFAGQPPWTQDQVVEWVDRPRSANSRKSMLTKLRPFCQWLVDEDVLDTDPTARIKRGPLRDLPPRCLASEDVHVILAATTTEREWVAVALMAWCGLRIGEVVAIDGSDIDMRRRTVDVRGKGGRGEVTRVMPVPPAVFPRLRRLMCGYGPVFRSVTQDRVSRDWLRRQVTEAMVDAGVKHHAGDGVSPHSLRHTFAQSLLDDGADIRLVQVGLGHASVRSTELYARREPPGLRDAVERLSA